MNPTNCFDSSRATRRVLVAPVSQIIDPLEVSHVPQRVQEYAEAMRRGERFPPIAVVRIAGRFLVADGHKRFAACKRLDLDQIPVELWSPFTVVKEQLRQTRDHYGRGVHILLRCLRDRGARQEARIFLRSEAEHYVRLARSLARRFGRRRGGGGAA